MWRLGSQLMELQRREEADDAPRLDPGSLRQAGAAINRRVGEFIKSTPDLLKYPLVAQPFHGCARDTSRVEIAAACDRSEEHTSELQSLMRISYAVFCLKKKNTTPKYQTTTE